MNKGIAYILMQKLTDIPYLQRFGGLVYTQEEENVLYDEQTGVKTKKRYPVTNEYCITKPGCGTTNGGLDMTPDSSYFGQVYFEDGGVNPIGREGRMHKYRSRLRMVVWLNTKMVVKKDGYDQLPGQSIALAVWNDITTRFATLEFTKQGYYQRFQVKPGNVPIQGATVFSAYTFDENANKYLMHPYEFFAIDLDVEYCLNAGCIDEITASVDNLDCLNCTSNAPVPGQYPMLDALLPYTVNLKVGIDTNTGEVIIPHENKLDLTKVVVLGGVVLGNTTYQEVPLNDEGTGWDFRNHAGNVEAGTITVIVRKKITQ